MTENELQRLAKLAGRALCLARLRDAGHITEAEYLTLLNDLRCEQGLWPIEAPHVLFEPCLN